MAEQRWFERKDICAAEYVDNCSQSEFEEIMLRVRVHDALTAALKKALRHIQCESHDRECGRNDGGTVCTCDLGQTLNEINAALRACEGA